MAYNGEWLLKLGGTVFPLKYIFYNTYKVKPKQRQDLDPWTDLKGYLNRNVLEHYRSGISFQTYTMWEYDFDTVMGLVESAYSKEAERKLHIDYYNPEKRNYGSGDFYLVQPEISIYRIADGLIQYNPVSFTFIEY